MDKDKLVEQRIAELTRGGETLAAHQRMGAIASNDEQRGFVDALDHVLALTRPTADLGEDGELVERVNILAHELRGEDREAVTQMRDRLILYREALAAVEHAESVEIARDIARALLSKNQGSQ